jgi:MoaA/NifB/PqqE/SkfB family radical SAM enzyme
MTPTDFPANISYLGETNLKDVWTKAKNIYWHLGNVCPYKCSYCPVLLHSGSFPFHPYEIIINIIKNLPKSSIVFGGGEPTYHPNFEQILKEKPEHVYIGVLSNGARPFDFWQRVCDDLDHVILSYHTEFAILDRFIKTATYLTEQKGVSRVKINLAMNPRKWDNCIEVYNALKSNGLTISCKPLLEEFGQGMERPLNIIPYTTEQLKWMQAHSTTNEHNDIKIYDKNHIELSATSEANLLASEQTNFSGWECYTPVTNLFIRLDGGVYNMQCGQKEKVGDIYNGFRINSKPVICKMNKCWCFGDLRGIKIKNPLNNDSPNSNK